MTQLATTKEVADLLRVKPCTVRDWFNAGVIPGIRINPRTNRFDYRAVVEALAKRGMKNQAVDTINA